MLAALALALLFAAAATAASLDCPAYESIASSQMKSWSLEDFAGVWHVVATTEPTIPSFCTCNRINATLIDTPANINGTHALPSSQWYEYSAATTCFGEKAPVTPVMRGYSNGTTGGRAGFLMENALVFGHQPALVPNMVFNRYETTDGQHYLMSYACLGKVMGKSRHSFNLLARDPALLPDAETIREMVSTVKDATQDRLDLTDVRIADATQWHKCYPSDIPEGGCGLEGRGRCPDGECCKGAGIFTKMHFCDTCDRRLRGR